MTSYTRHPPGVSGALPSVPRMRMRPILHGNTLLDGVWWPRSGLPLDELPGLVLALDERRGTVQRLKLGTPGWAERPGLVEVAGRAIRISWSFSTGFDVLTAVGLTGARTRLLVVPPSAGTPAPRPAREPAVPTPYTPGLTGLIPTPVRGAGTPHFRIQPSAREPGSPRRTSTARACRPSLSPMTR